MNKKSLTNLYDEPQLNATLFEPISPFTYDLGSSTYQWNDLYVNRIHRSTYPVECVVPTGIQGTGAPPATRTLNSGYEYYLQAVSSTNFKVFKYYEDNIPTEIDPPIGALFFATGALLANNHLYYLNSSNQWVRYGINHTSN